MPSVWMLAIGPAVAVTIVIVLASWLSQADTQRRIDRSALKTVAALRDEVKSLHEADQRSQAERARLRRTVDEVKTQVQGLKSEVTGWP